MNQRRVAVTGMGAVTPLGLGVPALWDGLIHGRSGVGPITRFDASGYRSQIAAEVKAYAKSDPGNTYAEDRRSGDEGPPPHVTRSTPQDKPDAAR